MNYIASPDFGKPLKTLRIRVGNAIMKINSMSYEQLTVNGRLAMLLKMTGQTERQAQIENRG